LAIYPTKYNICLKGQSVTYGAFYYLNHEFNIYKLINKYETAFTNTFGLKIDYFENITYENLKNLNINCQSSANLSSDIWCLNPIIYKYKKIELPCSNCNYLSGMYYDKLPQLDITLIRSPDDLEQAIKNIEINKLKNKINRSDYKINVESNILKDNIIKNLENPLTGDINKNIIKIILNYNKLKELDIFNNINENYISKLIWKTLNYNYYDIPPEWFNYQYNIEQINDCVINNYVKQISKIDGWSQYALYILLNDNGKNYNNIDVNTIDEKTKYYYNKSINIDYNKYKMKQFSL
jgi:hypothetical protein